MKAVIILGAGSHGFLGFPQGVELNARIGGFVHTKHHPFGALFPQNIYHPDIIKRFESAIEQRDVPTIDRFLSEQHRNEHFLQLGKELVAYVIANCENRLKLRLPHEDNWYKELNLLLSEMPEIVTKRLLSFITFNYDRSLDCYLYECLSMHPVIGGRNERSVDERNEKFVDKFLGPENYVHVYGQLGPLPWQEGGTRRGRDYGPIENRDDLETATELLRLPYQGEDARDTVIVNLLQSATHIFVMGFGYHQENLDRLHGRAYLQREGCSLNLTLHGLAPERVEAVTKGLWRSLKYDTNMDAFRALGAAFRAAMDRPVLRL